MAKQIQQAKKKRFPSKSKYDTGDFHKNILHEITASGKQSPLEFLLSVMWDEKVTLAGRIEAAKASMPYVHKKQPMELAHSGEVKIIPPYAPSKREWLQQNDPYQQPQLIEAQATEVVETEASFVSEDPVNLGTDDDFLR